MEHLSLDRRQLRRDSAGQAIILYQYQTAPRKISFWTTGRS